MDTIAPKAVGSGTVLQRASTADYQQSEDWPQSVFDCSDWLAAINRCHYALETATLLRRFFITENGHFGLRPPEMLPGDLIYVLRGGRFPFVLCAELAPSEYMLVGDCYLNGFMDSEGMQDFKPLSELVCIV